MIYLIKCCGKTQMKGRKLPFKETAKYVVISLSE